LINTLRELGKTANDPAFRELLERLVKEEEEEFLDLLS
jgi:hypothetical protein